MRSPRRRPRSAHLGPRHPRFGDGSPRSFWSPRRWVLQPGPSPVAPRFRWQFLLFVRVLLAYVPRLAANIHDPGPWTSGSELLALCGAALVLAGVMNLDESCLPRLSWCSESNISCMPASSRPWCRRGFRAVCSGHISSVWHLLLRRFYRHSDSGSSVGDFVGPHVFSVGAHPPSAQSSCCATQRK